ncbi:hypothetical protein [Taibaiella koreensis]|uniref:hypothetical protein n=1 Tax=Taibaiella koreensis TaxID=1268548 RepID=UPI000E59A460|nr:hypothetical protein [Taibaiella koreensis]
MSLKTKVALLGFVCLSAGGLWFYDQGHKDNALIGYTSIGLVYLGWILFLGALFGARLIARKKVKFAKHKGLWLKDKMIKLLLYSAFAMA